MKYEKKRLPHLIRRSESGVPSGTVVLKIINDTMALLKITFKLWYLMDKMQWLMVDSTEQYIIKHYRTSVKIKIIWR